MEKIEDKKISVMETITDKIFIAKTIDNAIRFKRLIIFMTFQVLCILSFLSMLVVSVTYTTGRLTNQEPETLDAALIMISFMLPVLLGIIFGLLAFITRIWSWKGFKAYGNKMVQQDTITSEMLAKWEMEAENYQETKYTNNELKRLRIENDRKIQMAKQEKELRIQLEKGIDNAK